MIELLVWKDNSREQIQYAVGTILVSNLDEFAKKSKWDVEVVSNRNKPENQMTHFENVSTHSENMLTQS